MVPESLTWSPRGVTDTLPNSSLPRDYVKIPRVLMVRLSNEPCRRCRHCRPCWRSPAAQNGWGDGETRTANKLCQVFRRLVVKALSNSLNPPTLGLPPVCCPSPGCPSPAGPISASAPQWSHARLRSVKACVSNQGEHMLRSRIPIGRPWPPLRSDKLGACRTSAYNRRWTKSHLTAAQLGSKRRRSNNRAHETPPHGKIQSGHHAARVACEVIMCDPSGTFSLG